MCFPDRLGNPILNCMSNLSVCKKSEVLVATLAVAIASFILTGCQSSDRQAHATNSPPPGFVALFNGTNLDGWWGATTEDPRKYMALTPAEFKAKHDSSLDDIRQHWSVQNGILVNDGKGLFLTTDKNYGDFELLVDYKTVPLADSGIYLRGCPQVQIWDSTATNKFSLGADKGSGGLTVSKEQAREGRRVCSIWQ